MNIIGAGMAGIVAGHYFRGSGPVIREAQPSLPTNHEALLRFRSDNVSGITGVPFRRVRVKKAIISNSQFAYEPNPYLANMYSIKVTGRVMARSIWDLEDCERFVAPPNFVQLAGVPLSIQYNDPVKDMGDLIALAERSPVISTMPMPLLMKLVNWRDTPVFEFNPIWSMSITIISPNCDVHQTIYYPDMDVDHYRASITGNVLIIEFIREPARLEESVNSVLEDFGLIEARIISDRMPKKQRFGKIVPIEDDLRKEFIYSMTREFNTYSLGRFATWRHILMDDVAKDCEVISNLIRSETRRRAYSQSLVASR